MDYIVQDIIINVQNTKYRRAWYQSLDGTRVIGELPKEIQVQNAPSRRSFLSLNPICPLTVISNFDNSWFDQAVCKPITQNEPPRVRQQVFQRDFRNNLLWNNLVRRCVETCQVSRHSLSLRRLLLNKKKAIAIFQPLTSIVPSASKRCR